MKITISFDNSELNHTIDIMDLRANDRHEAMDVFNHDSMIDYGSMKARVNHNVIEFEMSSIMYNWMMSKFAAIIGVLKGIIPIVNSMFGEEAKLFIKNPVMTRDGEVVESFKPAKDEDVENKGEDAANAAVFNI